MSKGKQGSLYIYIYIWVYVHTHKIYIYIWRRKWQPTPVFLPGESQGRGSLVSCSLWGHTESDTTEATQQQQHIYVYIVLWRCHPSKTYFINIWFWIRLSIFVCVWSSSSFIFIAIYHFTVKKKVGHLSIFLLTEIQCFQVTTVIKDSVINILRVFSCLCDIPAGGILG